MSAADLVVGSPIGPLLLSSNGAALTRVHFIDEGVSESGRADPDAVLTQTAEELAEYFAGRRRQFDVPTAPAGTEFQQRVWAQLRTLPFGTTASYGDLTARMGIPVSASRAVGLANGANPIAILVPCHRVIGADGTLVGYAGGLHRKRFLLALEAPTVQDALFAD